MANLIGKEIASVWIDKNEQHFLLFKTKDGEEFYYLADGDCCSESWFYEVWGIEAITMYHKWPQPPTVKDVLQMELPYHMHDMVERDDLGRQESDQIYGIKIVMTNWTCNIEILFRNSSNGYYGGCVCRLDCLNSREEAGQFKKANPYATPIYKVGDKVFSYSQYGTEDQEIEFVMLKKDYTADDHADKKGDWA